MASSGGSGQTDQNIPPPPPSYGELIPERYHKLRDAKTYTELRRILDRNGKYLKQQSCQGQRNKADATRDLLDGSAGVGCWVGSSDGQRAAARRPKQLSLGQCGVVQGSDEELERVEGVARRFANYYQHEGIQWHLDYLDACIERGEEVKQRFIEKQFSNGQGRKSRVTPVFSSVFKVHQSNSEVPDQLVCRKRVFRSTIMDSFPSKLNHEKSEKLQNLIDNLYQLKLENDDALPKIILTDCSSNAVNNPGDSRSGACRTSQNNNANSFDDGSDNRLNNNGCFLQPHSNNLKLGNSLGVPASSDYHSEARPP